MKIITVCGSLRQGSFNRQLKNLLVAMFPKDAEIVEFDPGTLPLYNQDLEADFPAAAQAMKDQIRSADLILIVTPEYNRSIPGVLKNLLDWTSRPYGDNPWDGKPVAICGASPGRIGTAVAQYHLKHVLNYLNARVMGQPEFYLGDAAEVFDAAGNFKDPKFGEIAAEFVKAALAQAQ